MLCLLISYSKFMRPEGVNLLNINYGISIIATEEEIHMLLYHGSKSGIKGHIEPKSRDACDFGQGFYMGDLPDQPKGLIAEFPHGRFYELDCDFQGLNVKNFNGNQADQIDWALYIAYNRGLMDKKYKNLCEKYCSYNTDYDVIIGLIADDKMTQALQRFFMGELCDAALIEAMQKVSLGKQYVMKTKEACDESHVRILQERPLTFQELKMARAISDNRNRELDQLFGQLKSRYRRAQNVKFFDEIIEEWDCR